MIKSIAKLIFVLWQSRQHGYSKPWKPKKRKGYKHGRRWAHRGYSPYGYEYGYLEYHRSQGVKGFIIDAVLRRLLHLR
jgi:hypothetical protein